LVTEWQVRKASVRDVDFVVKMIEAAARAGKFHSDTPSTEQFRKFAFEDPPRDYMLFVAQHEDEVIGYVDARVRRGVGLLLGLFVKTAFRNKGVGTALMGKVMEHFTRKACHKVRLEAFLDNCEAIDFYRRQGFETEGFLRKDEERRDTVIMSKFV